MTTVFLYDIVFAEYFPQYYKRNMDCCSSSYTDYRHTIGGANGLVNTNIPPYSHHQSHYHHNHPYNNQQNVMRYQQTASMYHHGGGGIRPPPNMYDNYEQFGYQTPPPPPPIPSPSPLPPYAYNGNHFSYNQRETGFYSHLHHHPAHHPYEGSPYRMSAMYPPPPYHHGHHIHRNGSIGPIGAVGPPEHYNSDIMYGFNRTNNGYLMRDTAPPPYHQYAPFHHTNAISRELYSTQQHLMPNSDGGGTQSAFVDTNGNNGSVHHLNGSICGEYPIAPATPHPSTVGPLNAFSSTYSTGKCFIKSY